MKIIGCLQEMFYIFCDEKYLDLDGAKRIITGYFAVPQDSWNHMSADRRALKVPYKIPRIARIEKILHDTFGVAVITYADLKSDLLPKGEHDGTNDVPDMSRYDNVWGAVVAYGLAATLKCLECYRLQVQNVDLYYDIRSLKQKQQLALERTVTQTLPAIINEGRRKGLIPRDFRAKIRRFQPISKSPRGRDLNKFQAGVLVAHYLLRNANNLIHSGAGQRIHVRNNTEVVKDYIQMFFGS